MKNDASWLRLNYEDTIAVYQEMLGHALTAGGLEGHRIAKRSIAENDLFFLLTQVLRRPDLNKPFFFERCREVQAEPDGHLDLWAREHAKSSIITYGCTLADIIDDPEITIGIFSHTRPIAKGFMRVIKREMEENPELHELWPEIFWKDPKKEAPKWSEDDGIVVKRISNPKECTIEAWGLVDGQPTSRHYKLRVYDDVVTLESVGTTEQIEKTTNAWAMSSNLGARGGRERYIGTRYHLFDTYHEMIKRKTVKVRVHAATDNGEENGLPVLLTVEELQKKRREQGEMVFACQMLLNPKAGSVDGFKPEWIKHADISHSQALSVLNRYLICDPSSKKREKQRKDPDYTSMWVIGAGPDKNYYVLDGIRDRLSLTERAAAYIGLHRKWQPKASGYEEYGLQADIEHIEHEQESQLYRFEIKHLGGNMAKEDRERQLIPKFEQGIFFLPKTLLYKTKDGRMLDLVRVFIEEEYTPFPVLRHDDMLDCMARILDPEMGVIFPDPNMLTSAQQYDFQDGLPQGGQDDWMLQ